MNAHTKIYFDYFGYFPGQWVVCECCEVRGADHVHHIEHGADGRKNHIENLAAVCYYCHNIIHNRPGGADLSHVLKKKHLELLESKKK